MVAWDTWLPRCKQVNCTQTIKRTFKIGCVAVSCKSLLLLNSKRCSNIFFHSDYMALEIRPDTILNALTKIMYAATNKCSSNITTINKLVFHLLPLNWKKNGFFVILVLILIIKIIKALAWLPNRTIEMRIIDWFLAW